LSFITCSSSSPYGSLDTGEGGERGEEGKKKREKKRKKVRLLLVVGADTASGLVWQEEGRKKKKKRHDHLRHFEIVATNQSGKGKRGRRKTFPSLPKFITKQCNQGKEGGGKRRRKKKPATLLNSVPCLAR